MKIGQKVVYIDNSPCRICGESKGGLNKGSIYVIQNTIEESGRLGLYLVGQPTPNCHDSYLPIAYLSSRFRLLDEMKKEAGELGLMSTRHNIDRDLIRHVIETLTEMRKDWDK